MRVRVFTDGACSGNPGPGGWSAVFNLEKGLKIISGYERETTNNRMELTSVIKAIEKARSKGYDEIEIYSDSSYVVNAVSKGWIELWQKKNWINSKNESVKNKDLWEKLIYLLGDKKVSVSFFKVKGHNGNTFNEIADRRAREEVLKAKLQEG